MGQSKRPNLFAVREAQTGHCRNRGTGRRKPQQVDALSPTWVEKRETPASPLSQVVRKSADSQSPKRSFSVPFFFYAAHFAVRLGPGCPLHFSGLAPPSLESAFQHQPRMAAPVQLSDFLPAVNSVFVWWIGSLFFASLLFGGRSEDPACVVFVALWYVHPFPKASWTTLPPGIFRTFLRRCSINCRQPQRFSHKNKRSDAPNRKAIATWTRGLFVTRRCQNIERRLRPFMIDSLPNRVPKSPNRLTNSVLRPRRSSRLHVFRSVRVTSFWESADRRSTVKRAKASISSHNIRP